MKKAKGIDGKLDEAWSKLVKLEWGEKCAYCGKGREQCQLHSHHIFSRSAKSTRWDTVNGICLCASHHVLNTSFSAHKTPTEFTYWLENLKGREWIEDLNKRNKTLKKWTKWEKEELLEELKDRIDELKTGH